MSTQGKKRPEPRPTAKPGQPTGSKQARILPPELEDWKDFVKNTRKNLLKGVGFVPPFHANNEILNPVTIKELEEIGDSGCVYFSQRPMKDVHKHEKDMLQESAVREDRTHKRVLHCIQAINDACPQTMTVISELRFEDYLSNPCYKDAAEAFPRPTDLDKKYRSGDFDILIIHRQYGFLIIEIKAVGELFTSANTEDKKKDAILKKIKLAIGQLTKEKLVLKHLVSDKKPAMCIKAALVLPNLEREQLQTILEEEPDIKKNLCECLDIPENEDPVEFCLCRDRMCYEEIPCEISSGVKEQLVTWWRRVFAEDGQVQATTDDDYIELVARFSGPATFAHDFKNVNPQNHNKTVQKKAKYAHYAYTQGEAVAFIGDKFNRRVLRPSQVEVLEDDVPLRFICGPPGTGKTVVLLLMACKWLLRKKHVHIASTWSSSLAASHLIAFELKRLCPAYAKFVHLHQFDLKEDGQIEHAVTTLLAAAKGDELCVICDEAFNGSKFAELWTKLKNNMKNLHMWAASVYHGYCPNFLRQREASNQNEAVDQNEAPKPTRVCTFTEPLRTPPVVTREICYSAFMAEGLVGKYTECDAPQPCDGPPPIRISHDRKGHTRAGWPGDCRMCGEELAELLLSLRADFDAVTTSSGKLAPANSIGNTAAANPRRAPLRFCDFFILSTYYDFLDEHTVQQEACVLVKTLQEKNIPVRVVKRGDSAALEEVAGMSGRDAVVVAEADTIRGLERKVVVWVESETEGNNSGEVDFARLDALSRTTSQLVIVTSQFDFHSSFQ